MSNTNPEPHEENDDDVASLKAFLEAHTDIEAALNHRFEYYVWFRGHDARFSHLRHEEIMVKIGQFVFEHSVGECSDPDPLYVFREYELWLELRVSVPANDTAQRRRFRMKSFSLDLVEDVEFVRTGTEGAKPAPSE